MNEATTSALLIREAGYNIFFQMTGVIFWGLMAAIGFVVFIYLLFKLVRFVRSFKLVKK